MTAMVFFIVIAATVFSYIFRYFSGDTLIIEPAARTRLRRLGHAAHHADDHLRARLLHRLDRDRPHHAADLPAVLAALDFVGYVGSAQAAAIWITALVALILQTSFLTPPFGFALFFLKGSAPPGVSLADIYRGVVPIVAIQLLVVGLILAMPSIATWLPIHAVGQ